MLSVRLCAEASIKNNGSCVPASLFKEEKYSDDAIIDKGSFEIKYPYLVGLAVDYLTRFSLGEPVKKAFEVSISGMKAYLDEVKHQASEDDLIAFKKVCVIFLSSIKNLDDESIEMACRTAAYDDVARGHGLTVSPPRLQIDQKSINNIREMVMRSKEFFQKNGPVVSTGFEFGPKGYSSIVSAGDGDFLTESCMWDMKVLTRKPNPTERLQVLMYWIMGQHSENPLLTRTAYTGIYNPRMNVSYKLDCRNLDEELIRTIEKEVICY